MISDQQQGAEITLQMIGHWQFGDRHFLASSYPWMLG